MTSKTSFFNASLLRDNAKRYGWIGIAYFIILFFRMPLKLMEYSSAKNPVTELFHNVMYLKQDEVQIFIILVFPILTAVFLFRFLHNRRYGDFIHSLPVKRSQLYWIQVATGVVLMFVPVLLIGILSLLLRNMLSIQQYVSLRDIGGWCLFTCFYDLVIFSIGVFVGIIVGYSVLQALFSYGILLVPLILITLAQNVLGILLYGYAYSLDDSWSKISPLYLLLGDYRNRTSSTPGILYGVYILLFLGFAWLLYRKRNVEASSETISYPVLQQIIKYGVTFCSMLIFGVYLNGAMNRSFGWLLAGFVFGGAVGYILSEMLIQKTIRITKAYKGFLCYTAVIAVILIGLQMDITGFQSRVPGMNHISYVSLNDYSNGNDSGILNGMQRYTMPEDIKLLRQLHKSIVLNRKKNGTGYDNGPTRMNMRFFYKLKNGKKLIREYYIDRSDYTAELKPLVESEEYKHINNEAYNLAGSDIDRIMISPSDGGKSNPATMVDPVLINEFMQVFKEEIHRQTYEETFNNRQSWGTIDFLVKEKSRVKYFGISSKSDPQRFSVGANFEKHFPLMEKWLLEHKLLQASRVMPADLKSIEIKPLVIKTANTTITATDRNPESLFKHISVPARVITDKVQIEKCLEAYQTYYDNNTGKYLLRFRYKNGYTNYGILKEPDIPGFLQ